MIHLLNGTTEERTRASEGVTFVTDDKGARCGCAHTDVLWLQMCDVHYREDQELHFAALNAHRLRALEKELT